MQFELLDDSLQHVRGCVYVAGYISNGTVIIMLRLMALLSGIMKSITLFLALAIQCSNAVALKTMCAQCTSLITNYVHIKVGGSMPLFTACAPAYNWQPALKRVRNG